MHPCHLTVCHLASPGSISTLFVPYFYLSLWSDLCPEENSWMEKHGVRKRSECLQNMINMSPKFSLQLNDIEAKYAVLRHFLFSQLMSRGWIENCSLSSKSKTNKQKKQTFYFMQLPFQINLEFLSDNLCWADVCFLDDCIGLFLEVSAWKMGETEDYTKFYHCLANTWGNKR